MTSLYELARMGNELIARAMDCDDADLATWGADVDARLELVADKFAACRWVIDKGDAEAEFYKAQAKLLTDRAKRIEQMQAMVKAKVVELLLQHETVTGEIKIKTADGSSVSLVRRTVQVVQLAEGLQVDNLPVDCQRVKVEADKVAIKFRLESGREVKGATLVDSTSEFAKWGR